MRPLLLTTLALAACTSENDDFGEGQQAEIDETACGDEGCPEGTSCVESADGPVCAAVEAPEGECLEPRDAAVDDAGACAPDPAWRAGDVVTCHSVCNWLAECAIEAFDGECEPLCPAMRNYGGAEGICEGLCEEVGPELIMGQRVCADAVALVYDARPDFREGCDCTGLLPE